jgi:uncharacterized protein (DUF488 family)
MYYRRKIFLALLESFGGTLDNTDFEKLLFHFCQFSGENHYDFFPYKYGSFSYISYQDRRVLISQGLLKDADKFSLEKRGNYLSKVSAPDQKSLEQFTSLFKNIRGNELIKKTYREYPYYAVKSEIAEKHLNKKELAEVRKFKNNSTSNTLFTLGYEGLTIDAYINKLISNNVALVIDVRKNPLSMKFGFSKTKMKSYLENAGIKYIHIPQLGIVSKLRKNIKTEKDYEKLFEFYSEEILPENLESIGHIRDLIKQYKRAALTCFESEHKSCHRHKITEWLEADSYFADPIVHI